MEAESGLRPKCLNLDLPAAPPQIIGKHRSEKLAGYTKKPPCQLPRSFFTSQKSIGAPHPLRSPSTTSFGMLLENQCLPLNGVQRYVIKSESSTKLLGISLMRSLFFTRESTHHLQLNPYFFARSLII